MRKTTVQIDDESIARARDILGTKGITDTIDAALQEVIAREARRESIELLRAMSGAGDEPDALRRSAWRWE